MIEILIALLAVTGFSIWAFNMRWHFFSDFVAPVFGIVGLVGLIVYGLLAYSYFAAEHKANIINREYGTNYTQIEVFYADSVIDTIRELDRKRVELNGDLITGK